MATDPYQKTLASKAAETDAWKNMVDSVVDFLSASRTMLQILTEKIAAAEQEQTENHRKYLQDRIHLEFLKDFLQAEVMKDDGSLKEIHVNKLFNDKSESHAKAEYYEKRLLEKFASTPKPHATNEFLDKQYNLTKQAIARRYQPQNRIAPVTKSNNDSKRDYFIETFTEGLHRINNVASESVQLKENCDEVSLKTPRPSPGSSSREKTYVLYKKI